MKALQKVMFIFCVSMFLSSGLAVAEDFGTEPSMNNGAKWRIGYYEGGKYVEYQQTLIATILELMELGWIEAADIPPQKSVETQALWEWLANEARSEFLEFVIDAHYTTNWTGELREQVSHDIIMRLNETQDIDMMIAMGTWAGQDLSNEKHQIPTIVLAVSDAVASGIVKSAEESGHAHIHARVDPFRYERQVRIFHQVINFQKLGMAYLDTVEGRSYAALDKVQNVADELGFEIVSCFVETSPDVQQDEQNVKECFKHLSKEVDAIYVTAQKGINTRSISDLVDIMNSAGIPTFSQAGSTEVKNGFLMSISLADFRYVGQFYAETIAKVFNGAKPGELELVFEDPPKIAINLKTTELIGYDPPVDVLGAADEIFQEIVLPTQ